MAPRMDAILHPADSAIEALDRAHEAAFRLTQTKPIRDAKSRDEAWDVISSAIQEAMAYIRAHKTGR